MKLEVIHPVDSKCGGGDCPTIYKTDRNTFVVQGYKLDNEARSSVDIPQNEDLVEIPLEFLLSFIEKNK